MFLPLLLRLWGAGGSVLCRACMGSSEAWAWGNRRAAAGSWATAPALPVHFPCSAMRRRRDSLQYQHQPYVPAPALESYHSEPHLSWCLSSIPAPCCDCELVLHAVALSLELDPDVRPSGPLHRCTACCAAASASGLARGASCSKKRHDGRCSVIEY